MRKNRLSYLLARMTLTLEEFAAESGIDIKRLRDYDRNPDAPTTAAVAEYFANHPRDKNVILNLLSREGGKISLNDDNLYDALGDYLSCSSCLTKYHCANGLKRLQWELYTARSYVFRGSGAPLLEQFCADACRIKELESALIVLCPENFENRQAVLDISARYSIPVFSLQTDPFPQLCARKRLVTGILPNHCLLEISDASEPVAVLTYDAARANGAYLRFQAAAPQQPAPQATLSSFRMAYLLSLTGMRNDTLSELLFIDKTLVSKWRNGKRRLRYYDGTLHRLAAVLCHSGPENEHKLRVLMEACFPSFGGSDELPPCLCKWLAYRESDELFPDGFSYLAYLGLQGVGDAVQTLLHYCRQISSPLEIRLVCFGGTEYLNCLDGLFSYLLELSDCRIRFICTPDLPAAGLRLYLHQNGKLARLRRQGCLSMDFCDFTFSSDCRLLVALPGIAVLNFSLNPAAPDQIQVHACYDKTSVDCFLRAVMKLK